MSSCISLLCHLSGAMVLYYATCFATKVVHFVLVLIECLMCVLFIVLVRNYLSHKCLDISHNCLGLGIVACGVPTASYGSKIVCVARLNNVQALNTCVNFRRSLQKAD